MKNRGGNDFSVDDDDMDALADLALGLAPEDEPDRRKRNRMERLTKIGVSLSARKFLSDRRKRQFIKTLAECGIVSRAAAAAGWTSAMAYSLRRSNEEFKTMWDNALEFATDSLEMEARRRGQMGVSRPVYQQGKLVGYTQEYSDQLLTLLLKGRRKEVFGDSQKIDAEVKGGVLVVPGVASNEGDWEQKASANQAPHRANQGNKDDPLD
jgi:hypothetical protein